MSYRSYEKKSSGSSSKKSAKALVSRWATILFFVFLLCSFNPFPTDAEAFGKGLPEPSLFRLTGYLVAGAAAFCVSWRLAIAFPRHRFTVPYRWTRPNVVVVAAVLAAASTVYSVDAAETLTEAAVIAVLMAMVAAFTGSIRTPEQACWLLVKVVGTCLALSIAGVLLMPERSVHLFTGERGVWLSQDLREDWRGLFYHKNYASGIVMYGLILAWPPLIMRERPLAAAMTILASLVFLWNAESVAAWISPAIALVATFLMISALPKRLVDLGAAAATAAALAAPFLVIFWLDPEFGFDLDGRAHIWRVNVSAFVERPIGGFGFAATHTLDTPLAAYDRYEFASRVGSHAHSGLVAMLGQLGVMGAVLYAVFLFQLVGGALRLYYRSGRSRARIYAACYLWACVAGVTRTVVEPDFLASRGHWYILILLFLAGRRALRDDHCKRETPYKRAGPKQNSSRLEPRN